jgi:hypothetical protein
MPCIHAGNIAALLGHLRVMTWQCAGHAGLLRTAQMTASGCASSSHDLFANL